MNTAAGTPNTPPVGKIGDDQLHDLARRRGMPVAALQRLLSPNL